MNRKRTYRTIINIIIVLAFTLIFTGIQNAGADETNYLTHEIHERMSHAETVRLVMEEDRSVSNWEVENIVSRMDAVQKSAINGVKGNYRANLNIQEKILLAMEENKELTRNNISLIIDSSMRTPKSYHSVDYIYGEVRANLSDKEREALKCEEG